MGTRNLTCVVKDGEFRVAQYCQWDGYPNQYYSVWLWKTFPLENVTKKLGNKLQKEYDQEQENE